MLNTTKEYLDSFKATARHIEGSVSYYNEGAEYILEPSNNLKSFKIEKTSPSGKFFGFAVAQRLEVEVLGIVENIQKGDRLYPSVGIKDNFISVDLPYFYVEEVNFNKVENTTIITGYDIIGKSNNILIKDVEVNYPLTLNEYSALVVEKLDGVLSFNGVNFTLDSAPNFEGNEDLATVLAAIAEASGSICYVQNRNNIKFRTLNNIVLDTLTPSNYFNFTTSNKITLTEIASATELGDNYTHGTEGYSQVLRENPFIDLAGDVASRLSSIGSYVIGLTGTAYELNWRGCPAYELGDLIEIVEKDGMAQRVYFLNETLTYNGGLSSSSNWDVAETERVDASPTSISKIISKTYAKVDKLNREIILAVEETEALQSEISSIKVEAEGILAQAEFVAEKADGALTAANNNMSVLSQQVQAAVTSEDVSIAIKQEISNGVTSVKTKTGFTFNEDGLTIDKSGSEMTTQITEDGMKVYRDNTEVLTANNKGVEAINLHATTFLTINNLTRFENYTNENDTRRTGCFWLD